MQDYLVGLYLDEYRLDALLNRGGMARIYRAQDVNLNRTVAIKVIDIPYRAESGYVQRFKREAQAIAQLDHPHIVRLYRYGESVVGSYSENVLYMAMQFIEGTDLQYVLDSYRKGGEFLELPQVSRILREVCEALDYAHARGVIHRDIKPSNIMLDRAGNAILTDFGLALLASEATHGEVFGSPHYIAPEQAMSSAKAVPQSDLYSVGVILYEMVTGKLPFEAGEPLELALQHMTAAVPLPRVIRPQISPELENVILRALSKQPENRYLTGQALAEAISQAIAKMKILGPPPRHLLAQRITQGWLEQGQAGEGQTLPMDPVPAARPGPATPPAAFGQYSAASPALTQPAGLPEPAPTAPLPLSGDGSGEKQQRRSVLGRVLTALLILLLCLGSGVNLYNIFLSGSLANQTSAQAPTPAGAGNPTGAGSPSPTTDLSISAAATQTVSAGLQLTATQAVLQAAALAQTQTAAVPPTETPTPTELPTPTATLTPTPTPTPPVTYRLTIQRRSEDKAYFLVNNTGDAEIPLSEISFQFDKGKILGSAWGTQRLAPDNCAIVLKEDRKGNSLPGGINCKLLSRVLETSNSQDFVYKDRMTLVYQNQTVGTCERDDTGCAFSFKK